MTCPQEDSQTQGPVTCLVRHPEVPEVTINALSPRVLTFPGKNNKQLHPRLQTGWTSWARIKSPLSNHLSNGAQEETRG